jgi:hypothetical protein
MALKMAYTDSFGRNNPEAYIKIADGIQCEKKTEENKSTLLISYVNYEIWVDENSYREGRKSL